MYPYLAKYLSIFERKKLRKNAPKLTQYDLILFGYNRIGYDLLKSFKKLKKKFLVVDYNPETILELAKEKIDCRYGDVDDEEFLNELNLSKTKMVVSTIPEFEANLLLVGKIRQVNKKAIILLVSHSIDEATELYKRGATYVILPHFLGGNQASKMIRENKFNLDKFLEERRKHIKYIKGKKRLGHEHPKAEKNK